MCLYKSTHAHTHRHTCLGVKHYKVKLYRTNESNSKQKTCILGNIISSITFSRSSNHSASACISTDWLISSTELHAVKKMCRVTVPSWSLQSGLHLAGSRVSWGREHTVLRVKKTDKVSQRFNIREPKTAFLRR